MSQRPLPTVIGPTENALRELLTQTLASTRIDDYPAWVVINAASGAGPDAPRGSWQRGVADALKIEPDDIDTVIARLRAAGLLDDDDTLTEAGATELAAARSVVAATTSLLVGGISDAEQESTRRVLDRIRRRAEELLSPPAPTTA